MTTTAKLQPFEGHAVVGSRMEINNAAGGLNDGLAVEAVAIPQGETVYVVMKVEVEKIRHDPTTKGEAAGDQIRVHIASAKESAFIDGELVMQALAEHRARIDEFEAAADAKKAEEERLAREKELGLQPIPFTEHDGKGDRPDYVETKEEESNAPVPIAGRRARKATAAKKAAPAEKRKSEPRPKAAKPTVKKET